MAKEKDPYPVKITRKGVLLWSLLIFIAMVWMFVVGIVVGRGMATIPGGQPALQQELETLKEKKLAEDRARIENDTHLHFYEELKKSAPDVVYKTNPPGPDKGLAVPHPPEGIPAPESPPSATARKSAATPNEPPAAERNAVAPKKAAPPSAGEPAPPVAQSVPAQPKPAKSQDRFTVQVGAFKDAESAQRMVENLKGRGYQAYFSRVQKSGKGVWFKVRVGVFKDRSAAEALLKKMGKQGIKGLVVNT